MRGTPSKITPLPLHAAEAKPRRADPVLGAVAWVALITVGYVYNSHRLHRTIFNPGVADILPGHIHYAGRAPLALGNLTPPVEYTQPYQHLGFFRSAKGVCLDAGGLAECNGGRGGQFFLLAANGRLVLADTVGRDPMACLTVDGGGIAQEPCNADGSGSHGGWTFEGRTLRHGGHCIIAATSSLAVVGDCLAASLDERTWYAIKKS